MIKVGFVAPIIFEEKINAITGSNLFNIQITNLFFRTGSEMFDIVNKNQERFDALLFIGNLTHAYVKDHCSQKIFWDVVPIDSNSLMYALFRARMQGYDISNISVDSFSRNDINTVYNEIGVNQYNAIAFNETANYVSNYSAGELLDYMDSVFEFHMANVAKGYIAVTGKQGVYARLSEKNLPCFLLFPTSSVIRDTLWRLKLKMAAFENETRQLVVLFVKINDTDKSAAEKNDYQHAVDKMKTGERVYLFAEKLQAAVVESPGSEGFLLFSTKSMVELETNNYQSIELIDSLDRFLTHTISIGIGYGKTANIAKHNAVKGVSKAEKCDRSAAFVVYENGSVIGPIQTQGNDEAGDKVDEYLIAISEKSGVSINRIYEIYSIINREKKDCFTSKELSERLKISTRSIDKILYKLEDSGYAKVMGRKIIEKGRPSRITKITF